MTTNTKNNLTTEEFIKLTDIILKTKKTSEDTKQDLYLYVLNGIKHQDFNNLDIKELVELISKKLNKLIVKEYNTNRTSFIFTLYDKYCKNANTVPVICEEVDREIELFCRTNGCVSNDKLLNKYKQEIIDILFT